jgi:hypothetical protein
MEKFTHIRINPLTHKMKNRVREHGDEWVILDAASDVYLCITPLTHLNESKPYMRWVSLGKDIDYEVTKSIREQK